MKYLVVTSWSEEGGKLYGEAWQESFKKHWPANAGALVVTDALIYSDPVAREFFDRHADKRMDLSAKGYNYRMDLYRFAHKIFALKLGNEKATEIGAEWVIWLDGDVVTKQKISEETLADWLPDDREFVYLSRRETWDHPECGFMGFKLNGRGTLEAVVSEWITDKVMKYAEQHDSHVIGELAKTWPAGWKFDLCPRSEGLDAFTPSPLGPYLDHRKGNRKVEYKKSEQVHFRDRYDLLTKLVGHFAPKRFIEVGTWNGERAKILAAAAHKAHGGDVFYIGYDLFGAGSPAIDAKELNVKRHFSEAEVRQNLDAFKAENPWFDYLLRPGDTWDTLRQTSPATADLAFIDGGHSVETIRHDFASIKAPVVILDDYYHPDAAGHPDIQKFGVNQAIRAASAFGPVDPVQGGGGVSLAYFGSVPLPVWALNSSTKEEVQKLTGGAFSGNVVLKTRNCRPEEEIRENIKTNLQKITQWIRPCGSHRTPQILVSAGESLALPETLEALRAWRSIGASIWCVKHSHNKLIENGIIPFACVLLDPRPHEGPSTHGHDRAEMLAYPHPEVRYLAASMIDPSVVVSLLSKGANVWGWHAAVGANEKEIIPKDHHLVPGGSTSVMRAISLGWMMGYRTVEAYAMDSCHFDASKLDMTKKNPDGTDRYFQIKVAANGIEKEFLTDRDLLAQAQDFTRLIKENPMLNITAHGPGMVPFIMTASRGNSKGFEEVYGFPPA
jgi:hypothetical protein